MQFDAKTNCYLLLILWPAHDRLEIIVSVAAQCLCSLFCCPVFMMFFYCRVVIFLHKNTKHEPRKHENRKIQNTKTQKHKLIFVFLCFCDFVIFLLKTYSWIGRPIRADKKIFFNEPEGLR